MYRGLEFGRGRWHIVHKVRKSVCIKGPARKLTLRIRTSRALHAPARRLHLNRCVSVAMIVTLQHCRKTSLLALSHGLILFSGSGAARAKPHTAGQRL